MASRSKLLFLNTEYGTSVNGSPSDVIFNLNFDHDIENMLLSVQSFNCPNLVYPINTFNNKLYFKEAGGATLTATIPAGNYDGSTILTVLKTQLEIIGILTYTVSLDQATKLLSISATGNVQFVSGANSIYRELGFVVPTSNASSITGSYPINLSGSNHIDIQTDIGSHNYAASGKNNILFRVPLTVGFGGQIYYDNTESDFMRISTDNLRNLELRLLDDRGRPWLLPPTAIVSIVLKLTRLE
jgi:hypothetical protein